MGAELRVLRRRVKSVESTKKITRAQELIASSRIVKAQQRVAASAPYAEALTEALTAAASHAQSINNDLLTARPNPTRAAVILVTADRGFAGAYSANAIREARALIGHLEGRGLEVELSVVGLKGVAFFSFRGRAMANTWSGFTGEPQIDDARTIAAYVLEAYRKGGAEGGVDEVHVVGSEFVNMVTQRNTSRQLLPIAVAQQEVSTTESAAYPLYSFEPSAEAVLEALLPRYVEYRLYYRLLHCAATEHASRQRAMKSATDNATELITNLTRRANQVRQTEITQEISEIVGGADALASAAAGHE